MEEPLTEYIVTIKVDAHMDLTIEAKNNSEAEDKVWAMIGDYCENLDADELIFGNVDVTARKPFNLSDYRFGTSKEL